MRTNSIALNVKMELSLQERMKCRYPSRAGVISRHERFKEQKRFVVTSSLHEKAGWAKRTAVRDGMSACDSHEIGTTLQSNATGVFKGPAENPPIINE